MTRLIASITGQDWETLRVKASRALSDGADAVELRLDTLAPEARSAVPAEARSMPGPWIATCRPVEEGGQWHGRESDRIALLRNCLEAGADWIDIERSTWREQPDVRSLAGDAHEPRLIVSDHDFAGRPADPPAAVREIARSAACIPKLAWKAENIIDALDSIDALRSSPAPSIVIAMGEAGFPSRVLARRFNAFGSFCVPAEDEATAPGQATLRQMLDLYRWKSIDAETHWYGVIGWPVAHSMSPLLHNAAFDRAGFNGVYLPVPVDPAGNTLETFLHRCENDAGAGASGFSVTVPHKARVINFLRDRVDDLAGRIGAVNTLVLRDGRYYGYNTDYSGALDALTDALGCERPDLSDTAVDVIGAGGAARAVVAGLRESGARVTISNIVPEDADRLASEFDCAVRQWEERTAGEGRILVNATSLGMWPEVDATPLPADALGRYEAVFDAVYNPMHTRLLREAQQAGCRTISGLEMFVNQAAEQFRLWTQTEPDKALMRELVAQRLQSKTRATPRENGRAT